MADLIADLTEERAQITDAIESMVTADGFDPEGNKEYAELKTRGEYVDRRVESLRELAQHREASNILRDHLTRVPAAKGTMAPDVGEQLMSADAWKTYQRNGYGGRAHLMSLDLNRRALITSSFLPGTTDTIVGRPPATRTPLIDLMRNVQVDALTVPIVSHPDSYPLAGNVAEGAQKPEATIGTTEWTVTLETIAHWVEVSRQALADNSLVRDLISTNLLRGVDAKAEANAAAIVTGGTFTTVSGASMLEAIRQALATVQSQGYSPNGILINPADAASLDISIWAVAASFPTVNNSLFGLRVVPSVNVPQGAAYVGDFDAGTAWFYRASAELYVSDSDVGIVATAPVSNFKRNVITFLAEVMAKGAIIQGGAIVKAQPGAPLTASAPKPAAK